jgi:hypothetical protein
MAPQPLFRQNNVVESKIMWNDLFLRTIKVVVLLCTGTGTDIQVICQHNGGVVWICENPNFEKVVFKIPSSADIDGRMQDVQSVLRAWFFRAGVQQFRHVEDSTGWRSGLRSHPLGRLNVTTPKPDSRGANQNETHETGGTPKHGTRLSSPKAQIWPNRD